MARHATGMRDERSPPYVPSSLGRSLGHPDFEGQPEHEGFRVRRSPRIPRRNTQDIDGPERTGSGLWQDWVSFQPHRATPRTHTPNHQSPRYTPSTPKPHNN